MGISVLPKTSLGDKSVRGAAAFLLLFVLFQTFAASIRRNPVPNPSQPSLAFLTVVVLSYALGIFSFVTGLISIINRRERSILVFSVVVAGFLASFFLLGKILFEH